MAPAMMMAHLWCPFPTASACPPAASLEPGLQPRTPSYSPDPGSVTQTLLCLPFLLFLPSPQAVPETQLV